MMLIGNSNFITLKRKREKQYWKRNSLDAKNDNLQ